MFHLENVSDSVSGRETKMFFPYQWKNIKCSISSIFHYLELIFLEIYFTNLLQLHGIRIQDVSIFSPPASAAARPGSGPTDWRPPLCWEKAEAGLTPLVPGWVLVPGSPLDPWAEPAAPPHGTPPLTGSQGSLTKTGKKWQMLGHSVALDFKRSWFEKDLFYLPKMIMWYGKLVFPLQFTVCEVYIFPAEWKVYPFRYFNQ